MLMSAGARRAPSRCRRVPARIAPAAPMHAGTALSIDPASSAVPCVASARRYRRAGPTSARSARVYAADGSSCLVPCLLEFIDLGQELDHLGFDLGDCFVVARDAGPR